MHVGLFVPCYINHFYPNVAIAVLEILERQNVKVTYPADQACCGQPMANSGFEHLSQECAERFVRLFEEFDYTVCPSGSCALHLKEHLHGADEESGERMRSRIFEMTEFLTDILDVRYLTARFPYKVAIHQSCHGQRGLRLAQMSELMEPGFSKPEKLLKMVDGLQLVALTRPDECCGFGGMFSVGEEAVSVSMGKSRLEDFSASGAEYITSADMSCLMHLDGILRRERQPLQVVHIAEILNAR